MRSFSFFSISCVVLFLPTLSEGACNGQEAYCSKYYNQMTFLVSHNAQSFKKSWILSMIPKGNIHNQDRNLRNQFSDGVRAFKMPIFPYKNTNYACHGASPGVKNDIKRGFCSKLYFLKGTCESIVDHSNPCSLDPGTERFQNILGEIRDFISQHPNEVVTLFIEDYVDDFKEMENEFAKAGLTDRVFKANQPWQTLGEMIRENHQLVLFIDRYQDKKGQWYNQFPLFHSSRSELWSSKYTFLTVSDLENDDLTPHLTRPGYGQLWSISHYVTPGLAGSIDAAKKVNRYSFLNQRISKYINIVQRNPNFISVDFYEDPDLEAFKYINELNNK